MLLPFIAFAAQVGDSNIITFSGKLQGITYCNISNNSIIEVPFGNVSINKLSSGQYIKTLDYTLNCGVVSASNTVSMMFKSSLAAPNSSAIPTSIDGLVVNVLKDGLLMPLNTNIEIDPKAPPKLQLQLDSLPNSTLVEAPFTATGTMVVEYI